MPKFNVLVTRDTTESTVIDVVAATKEVAEEAALKEARDHPQRFTWTGDDTLLCDPYVADPQAIEEVA